MCDKPIVDYSYSLNIINKRLFEQNISINKYDILTLHEAAKLEGGSLNILFF